MLDKALEQLLSPAIMGLGYELVGIERLSQGKRGLLLRIYIDSEDGITLDDCERVSHQVSGILDVEDPIPGHYILEVSSPGLDRPLFTLEQYQRFIGKKATIRLHRPLDTRRVFTGILQQIQEQNIIIVVEGREYSLPYQQIEKARIVPEEFNK